MEPHKHAYVFRESDVDRAIARYGQKPPQALREQMISSLRKEREKFRRIHEFRNQNQSQNRNRGPAR